MHINTLVEDTFTFPPFICQYDLILQSALKMKNTGFEPVRIII
jgi:hypothetical protein